MINDERLGMCYTAMMAGFSALETLIETLERGHAPTEDQIGFYKNALVSWRHFEREIAK